MRRSFDFRVTHTELARLLQMAEDNVIPKWLTKKWFRLMWQTGKGTEILDVLTEIHKKGKEESDGQ